jgi:hypothetical protein
MKKLIIILILCLSFQSCVKCYKEKDYSLEKEKIEEKIEINGIDDLYIIGSELSLHMNEKIISKGLYLKNIKIYYKENFLGTIEINTKLIEISHDKEYTSNGDLIKRISLREELIKILEKEEVKLKINEDYMSEELTFVYEFYDARNEQKISKNISYRLSKHEKGCRKWIPDI